MKKSLLVISVILLIAGLFISCNSEAAGTNSEVGYVKFGGSADSKSLSSSVTPEDMPSMNSLYWYYKASPVSPGLFVRGERTSWTRVNTGTGFGGAIGPFTKGNWQFELVGSTSANAPSADTSYNGSEWTIAEADDDNIKYYGVSGTVYDTKTSVYIDGAQNNPTPIGVSLKFNSSATPNKFTLVLHDLTLIDSEYLVSGQTVYYKVTNDTTLIGEIGHVTTADHKAVISTDVVVNNVSCSSGEAMTLTVGVYEDSGCSTAALATGDVSIIPLTGSTVTVTGSLDDLVIDYGYGEFGLYYTNTVENAEAYVYNGSTATQYATLSDAITAANAGETVGLLKDLDFGSNDTLIEFTLNNITLDLNGHTVTTSFHNESFGGSAFTIKNGKFRRATDAGSYALFIGWDGNTATNGILKDVVIHNGLNVSNMSTITLDNVVVHKDRSADYYGIWVQGDSTVTLINNTSVDVTTDATTAYVFGVGKGETQEPDFGIVGTIEVYSGAFNKGLKSFALMGDGAVAGTNLKICGGTFDVNPTDYVPSSGYTITHNTEAGKWTVTPSI